MKELDDLIGLFQPDTEWAASTKERYGRLFRDEPLDTLLLGGGATPPEPHHRGRFNMKEQYERPECMFYEGLRGMVGATLTRSDTFPAIRANLGTGFVPSVFGVEQLISEDKMPWPVNRIPKEQLQEMQPADLKTVADKGLLPRAREIYELYKDKLGTTAWCYIPDTQGVLDIAHLVRGHDIFYDLYDDPEFLHHLMELCLQAYISVTRCMKEVIGEPLDSGLHGGMAMANGGVRYCMDTGVLLSEELIEEFEVPYLRRALQAFGGGWVHFCGYAPHVVDALVAVPEVRGINPNYMDTEPYEYERDMRKIRQAGKFFSGAPFKSADESTLGYFRRVLTTQGERKGLHFSPRGKGVEPADFDGRRELWQQAEREVFGGTVIGNQWSVISDQ